MSDITDAVPRLRQMNDVLEENERLREAIRRLAAYFIRKVEMNPNRENTIPLNECRNGWVYRLSSRNLVFGVFVQASNGFIGIREKFKHKYLFTEYHWDTGAPFGTVRPKEELEPAPPGLVLEEHGPLINDENDRVVVREAGTEYPAPPIYRYVDTAEICDTGEIVWSRNQPLYDYMLQIEDKYSPCTEERGAKTEE